MADIAAIAQALADQKIAELVGQDPFLQFGGAINATPIELDPNASSLENFGVQFARGLLGSGATSFGANRVRSRLNEFNAPVNQALASPNNIQALQELSSRPGFESVSALTNALLLDQVNRRNEIQDMIAELQLKQQFEPPQVREIKVGDEIITQQFNPATRSYEEIGRAERFRPAGVTINQGDNFDVGSSSELELLNRVPKAQRNTVIKELGIQKEFENSKNVADDLFNQAQGISSAEALTPFSEGRSALSAINANLAGVVAGAIKGNPSVDETKRQILPFLIDPLDTTEKIKEKRDKLVQFMELNKKATPLVDIVKPTNLEQQEIKGGSSLTPEQQQRLAELEAKAAR